MARIGILGGTFDPPHNAHLAMARTALERIPLDEVLFAPTPRPPHKTSTSVSPYVTRVRMVELAISAEPGLTLSRIEEAGDGPSYTAELLRRFGQARAGDDPYLILGADSVGDLSTWKSPESVLELATLVIFPRRGYASVVPVDAGLAAVLFEDPMIDVSSTDIRRRCRRGESVESLLPPSIHKFILDNHLYS